jgi:hypothetical protein
MAVLSSLLGIGQQQPVAGPAIATTAFPAELAPYYKDILSKAQALYEDRTAEGYQPYQGPTIAEFTPEQQQAFAGIAGLAGQQAPKFAEAEQLTRQAAAPIATADIEQFMNPYQQAVVDIEKREAQKQFEQKTLPSIRAAQVAQGAFGGTRGTLLEAQTLAEQDRLLADIQARGSQQAFTQALQQAQAQRAREGQAAAQLATMAPQAFKAQLGELGAVQTVGEEKQRQAQTALNEAYKQFVEERQFPQQSLGQYQAVVQAQPASQMLETVQYAPPPPPLGQQLLGGLGTLVGTYGAFGGFSPGGLFGKSAKTGGGIEDLPVVQRQFSGPVESTPGFLGFMSRGPFDNIRYYYNRFRKDKDDEAQKFVDRINAPNQYLSIEDQIIEEQNKKFRTPDDMTLPDEDPRLKFTNIDPIGEFDTSKYAGGANRPIQDMTGAMDAMEAQKLRVAKEKFDNFKGSATDALKDFYESIKKVPGGLKEKLTPPMDSPAASDIEAIKEGSVELLGETLDMADLVAKYGVRGANQIRAYFGKGSLEELYGADKGTLEKKGIGRETFSKILNIPELKEDKSIKELASVTEGPGLLPYLNKQLNRGTNFLEDAYRKIMGSNASNEVKKQATEFVNKNIKDDKTISKMGQDVEQKDDTKIVKDDKAIVTEDGVVKQVKPEVVDEQQKKDVKQKEKKVNKLKEELDKNPKDTKTKSALQTARDDYLEALKKQKDDLGKQKSNIDDARRKSMFEFLAKVSSKYGQGATLPEAAASELDAATKRTRQLDQAALDLQNKQRQAELTAKKELVSQEEKKAAAAVETGKEATRKREKAFDQFIKLYEIDTKAATEGIKPKRASIGTYKSLSGYLDDYKDIYKNKLLNLSDSGKEQFIAATGLSGVNTNNFDDAVKTFINKMDDAAIYSAMKNNQRGGAIVDSEGMDGLYEKSFLNLWRNAKGTYKGGKKFLGFTFGSGIE